MADEQLIKSIQEILANHTPIKDFAVLRDTEAVPREEIHYLEAEKIAELLESSQNPNQLQGEIYNLFVQYHEYCFDFEKVMKELEGGESAPSKRTCPGGAGTLEDYTTIAQKVFALRD